jgi:hypothetical protein
LKKLEVYGKEAGECISTYAREGLFEVECRTKQFVVDLMHCTCGCRQRDMTGIPCPHAISIILHDSSKPEDYLHQYYNVENYKRAYDPMIFPMPSGDQWVRIEQDEVNPPVYRAASSKPKKLRSCPNEPRNPYSIKKGEVNMRCSKCMEVGHSSRTCPRRKRVSTSNRLRRSVPTSIAIELSFNDVNRYPKYL